MKIYHQQAANLNDSDQNIDFLLGENNNYHQIGIAYIQKKLTKKEVANAADSVLVYDDVINILNNAFAHCFKEARLSTTGSLDIEHNKFLGQFSTNMRVLTSKDGDLLCNFDEINESHAEIDNTSLKHMLINSHDVVANKGKLKAHLRFENFFGVCSTLKNH